MTTQKILLCLAHPDDEILGPGGTIAGEDFVMTEDPRMMANLVASDGEECPWETR